MYALNLNKETGRILSATYPEYAAPDAVFVAALPEGDISDYLYRDGEFIYDPLPVPEEPEPTPSQEERIAELEAQNAMLMECVLEMSEVVYA